MNRRNFITASAGAAGSLWISREQAKAEAEKDPALFSFVVLADAQYVDAKPAGSRHYKNSVEKLNAAAKELAKQENLAFSLHLGDVIDRDFESFDAIMPAFEKVPQPCYHLLGNHDFSVDPKHKPKVRARMGMKSNYYDFGKSGVRFIVLDGTDLSTYAHAAGSKKMAEGQAFFEKLKAAKAANAYKWNSGIGNDQLAWLAKTLETAKKANERVILACHYPVFPVNSHNLWNDTAVLELIDRFPNVLAWFNGHNHAGNYGERKGVHYLTVRGVVETESSNAFATVEVFKDRLVVDGFGREKDQVLKISDSG